MVTALEKTLCLWFSSWNWKWCKKERRKQDWKRKTTD